MMTTRRQRIAMALLVTGGLLACCAVLFIDRPASPVGAEPPHAEAPDGHVAMRPEGIAAAGIGVAVAGPAALRVTVRYPGEIRFDGDRTAHVVPRAAGVVEHVTAQLGQRVRAGDVLATISSASLSDQRSEWLTAHRRRALAAKTFEREKTLWAERISARQDFEHAETALQEADIAVRNASQKLAAIGASGASSNLNRFEIRAPFAGTIVEKHIAIGEAVREDASIFTISDLASVWAEFAVAPRDLATVRAGQKVVVSSTAFDGRVDGTVTQIGSLLGEQTRTAKARVTLVDPGTAWRPGLFVTVAVEAEPREVAIAVTTEAVQTIDGRTVVFVRIGDGFALRDVRLGLGDGARVEVLEGLRAGESYATSNAFVVKAELGKAGAAHGH